MSIFNRGSQIPIKEEVNSETRFHFQDFLVFFYNFTSLVVQHSWRWLGGLRSNAGPDRAAPQLTAEQPTSFHQSESCSCLITPDNLKTLTTPTKVRAFSPSLLSPIFCCIFQIFLFLEAIFSREIFSDLKSNQHV